MAPPSSIQCGPAGSTVASGSDRFRAITEQVVSSHLDVAHAVELDLDRLETTVLTGQTALGLLLLRQFKHELSIFRRAVQPLLRPVGALLEGRPVPPPEEVMPLLRTVHDRLARAAEQVRSFDDQLNYLLMTHLATVDVEQNRDMRKIASWASIAAVWGLSTGLYQMTGDLAMLHGDRGPFTVAATLAVSIVVSVLLYLRLHRSGWL